MKSTTWLRSGVAVALLAGMAACSTPMGRGLTGSSSAPRTASVTPPPVAPEMVREVQSRLSDGGYYQLGAIDGIWGTGTETAVKNFQRDHDLGTSGKLDVPTLQALNLTATAPAAPDRPAVTSLPQTGAGDTSAPVQQR